MTAHCANTDDDLREWLRWAESNGSGFLRAIAEAAFVADLKNYDLLRPLLLRLKSDEPRSGGQASTTGTAGAV